MSITVESGVQAEPGDASRVARDWLVAPWFDLLFVANLLWPIAVLLQLGQAASAAPGLPFWQLYYITTPHRWATLLLVFLDKDRFQKRRTTFLLVAAGAVALCVGVRLSTGALTCLLAVDYVWNAWHFASQHHGIYRIYSRRDAAARETPGLRLALEKWALRGFLLFVILRVASATWSEATFDPYLRGADWVAVIVPLGLLARELVRPRPARSTYLVSVCALYAALLWAVHARRLDLVLALATASALFHAVEYLALISWSVGERHAAIGERMGILGYLAPRWALTLAVFVVVLGAGGWLLDQHAIEFWLLLNVIAAFLHYAYDGLIWRRRSTA